MIWSVLRFVAEIFTRFRTDQRGVGAVEFAGLVPVMIFMYMGSMELSSVISVDKRVSTVAGAIGDLVARHDGTLSQSTLDDYFAAASATMAPYSSDDLTQVVTSVYIANDGTTTVQWSRAFNGGTVRSGTYPLPSELTDIARNSYVIVAEAGIAYTPILGYVFPDALNLYREFFFLPRFGEAIAVS